LDYNYTWYGPSVGWPAWTFSADRLYGGAVVHIYNMQNALGGITDYERVGFDWQTTPNVFRIMSQKNGSGTIRLIAIDGFQKAGAPAAGDLPSGSYAVIDDTSANQTWLAFNKAGTIRKTQLNGAGGGAATYIQDTAPVGATVGSMWWNSTNGQLYVYYNDGTSTQWVSASGINQVSIGLPIATGVAGSVLYVDSTGALAQDNANFSWDYTNYQLKIGHSGVVGTAYYVNGVPGLYVVPSGSGNNWFEGNSGNLTTTGYSNFGTGDLSLSSLTSGYQNTAVGTKALQYTTTDYNNTALGSNALLSLGYSGAGGSSTGNFAMGTEALANMTSGGNNTGIGFRSMFNLITGDNNTCVGFNAGIHTGQTGATRNGNTYLGPACGQQMDVSYNTWVGGYQGDGRNVGTTILLSTGFNSEGAALDYSFTTTNVWSMGYDFFFNKGNGLHIYNIQTIVGDATNYERAILDWNPTVNVFRIGSQAGGTGTIRIIVHDAFSKAGAPAAADLPAGTCAFIDDTTNNQTWLVFNKAGTIRKVQLT